MQSNPEAKRRRCLFCGNRDHETRACPDKEKGRKCFKCNEHGHLAPECTKGQDAGSGRGAGSRVNRVDQAQFGEAPRAANRKRKLISIKGVEMVSLIDSGSDYNLLREDVYKRIEGAMLKNQR